MCWQTRYVGICGCGAISSKLLRNPATQREQIIKANLSNGGIFHLSACDLPLSIVVNASLGAETMLRRPLKREERGDVRSGEVSTKGRVTENQQAGWTARLSPQCHTLMSLSNSREKINK